MVSDARSSTKFYLDFYLDTLTIDDGYTAAYHVVMWSYPDYPIILEFINKGVDLIYSVGKPTSTPMLDLNQVPYGYHESLPIEVFTIDKTNKVTGVKMLWKGEAELRRVLENYPTGSQRWLSDSVDATHRLGSTTIHGVKIVFEYERDTT